LTLVALLHPAGSDQPVVGYGKRVWAPNPGTERQTADVCLMNYPFLFYLPLTFLLHLSEVFTLCAMPYALYDVLICTTASCYYLTNPITYYLNNSINPSNSSNPIDLSLYACLKPFPFPFVSFSFAFLTAAPFSNLTLYTRHSALNDTTVLPMTPQPLLLS
jgi:hypothetical protein